MQLLKLSTKQKLELAAKAGFEAYKDGMKLELTAHLNDKRLAALLEVTELDCKEYFISGWRIGFNKASHNEVLDMVRVDHIALKSFQSRVICSISTKDEAIGGLTRLGLMESKEAKEFLRMC